MSALDQAAALIEVRYLPKSRRFETEMEGRFVGGSTIVKEKAADYGAKVIANVRTESTEEDRYWSFRGNALSEAALADFPHREIRVEASLRDRIEHLLAEASAAGRLERSVASYAHDLDWSYRGHLDAVLADDGDGTVCVVEHKSHGSPTPTKVDRAFRQGAGYLAVMHHVASTSEPTADGTTWNERVLVGYETKGNLEISLKSPTYRYAKCTRFGIAEWCDADDVEPFVWRESNYPEGVLVAVAPYDPPGAWKKFPLTAEQLAQVRDFVLDKAAAVAYAGITGDLHYCNKWDEEHPTEFLVPFAQIDAGIPELDDIGRQLAEQLAILTPKGVDAEVLESAEKEVKRLRQLADLAMAKHGVKSGVFGGTKLSRRVVKGREVPAKDASWQEERSYVVASLVGDGGGR